MSFNSSNTGSISPGSNTNEHIMLNAAPRGSNRNFKPNYHLGDKYSPNTSKTAIKSQEKFTFKTKLGENEGPTDQIHRLHEKESDYRNVLEWINTFKFVSESNSWEFDMVLRVLKITTEISLHYVFDSKNSLETCLKALKGHFFPEQDFIKFQEDIENLKSYKFSSIQAYLKALRELINAANLCISKSDKINDREAHKHFCNGLTNFQKKILLNFDHKKLEDLAIAMDQKLDLYRRLEIKNNYEIQNSTQTKRDNGRNENRRHQGSESRTGSKKTVFNDGRYFRDKYNSIKNKKTVELENIEFEGLINQKKVLVVFDTGSKKSFISSSVADGLRLVDALPFETIVANGQTQVVDQAVSVDFELFQLPHQRFTESAYIMKGLNVDLT